MGFNFADLFEVIARHKGDKPALVHDGQAYSWAQFEDRSARLAGYMVQAGLQPGAKVGLYLQNCNVYMEATFAAFKARMVPININYRYQFEELAYLVDNADLEGLVFHTRYADGVRDLARRHPQLKLLVAVDDGAGPADFATPYEAALSERPMPPVERSGEDLFIFYTGGTTGMPKGVIYHQATYSSAVMPNLESRGIAPATSLADMPRFLDDVEALGIVPRTLPLCPLMHLTAFGLGALLPYSLGGCVVTMTGSPLDAPRVWRTVAEQEVTTLVIVGDTFSRALVAELNAAVARGAPLDLPKFRSIISSGAMWSREMKEQLLAHLDIMLLDGMGSTEGGIGASIASRTDVGDTAAFKLHPGVKVFTDDGREVKPGSEEIGRIAVSGNIPIGYYKDEAKTRATFREIDGIRYSIAGDYAKVAADGQIVLLGRGSACINTAGEKVFPEEVEEVLKLHPAVDDAAVLGMPDDTYGERVAAVVATTGRVTPEELVAFARTKIAGYKAPRQVILVEATVRSASGKLDYAWARSVVSGQIVGERPVG